MTFKTSQLNKTTECLTKDNAREGLKSPHTVLCCRRRGGEGGIEV